MLIFNNFNAVFIVVGSITIELNVIQPNIHVILFIIAIDLRKRLFVFV